MRIFNAIGVTGVLQIAFIVLKAAGALPTVPWLVVLAPVTIIFVIAVAPVLVVLVKYWLGR